MSSGSGAHKGFDPTMVIVTAVSEYKSMQARGVWDKLGPHQAHMDALLTIAAKNSQRPSQSSSTGDLDRKTGGRGGPGGDGGGKRYTFEPWQTEFKGATIVRNKKTWWFCKQHNEGKGLYVCHPPGDHDAWKASKDKMKETNAKFPEYKPPDPLFKASAHTTDGTGDGAGTNSNSTLELGEELKQVLASFGMSSGDAEEAWTLAKERASKT